MSEHHSAEELVRLARAGDKQAFDELVGVFQGRLETQIRARMGPVVRSSVEAEDILQETLLQAHRAVERLEWRGEEAFYRWLGSIAEHVIHKAARGAPRFQLGLDEEPAGDATSVSRAVTREERAQHLDRVLKDLSPDHRDVIVSTISSREEMSLAASRRST